MRLNPRKNNKKQQPAAAGSPSAAAGKVSKSILFSNTRWLVFSCQSVFDVIVSELPLKLSRCGQFLHPAPWTFLLFFLAENNGACIVSKNSLVWGFVLCGAATFWDRFGGEVCDCVVVILE